MSVLVIGLIDNLGLLLLVPDQQQEYPQLQHTAVVCS
jgi:hypothetical protein